MMCVLAAVQGLFEDVEKSLILLEDMIEVQELQEKQLDRRFSLALYKERRNNELSQLKGKYGNFMKPFGIFRIFICKNFS